MDFTLMSLRAMLETAVSVGVGVGAVSGFGIWLFREKIKRWLDGWLIRSLGGNPELDDSPREALDRRIDGKVRARFEDLEDRMGKSEESAALMAQAATNISNTLHDGMQRMTKAFEAVGDEVKEQGKAIARVEGTIERRGGNR